MSSKPSGNGLGDEAVEPLGGGDTFVIVDINDIND